MGNLEDIIAKNAYNKIRNNTLSESVMFATIEMYIKRPLIDAEKARIREYAAMIRSGELSFEDYRILYQSKIGQLK